MRVLAASNGILPTVLFGPVDTVVPAKVSAVADFTTFATLFPGSVGSTTTVESPAPPKPVNVYVTEPESNVIAGQPGGGDFQS